MTLTNTSNFQRFFMESGYYLLKGVIEDEFIRSAYQDSIKGTTWEAEGRCVSNQEGKIIKVYELYQRNIDSFRKIIFNSVLLDYLEIILGPNILFLKNRHNFSATTEKANTRWADF